MLLIGISWLVYWLLTNVFILEAIRAALVTGLIFLVLGLLTEGVPNFTKRA